MQFALLDLPWWACVLVTLGLTHVTIASVMIFLLRHQGHRAQALPEDERAVLERALNSSPLLSTIDAMRQELTALRSRSAASKEQLVRQLEDWYRGAEQSGIAALRDSSRTPRCYEPASRGIHAGCRAPSGRRAALNRACAKEARPC